MKVIILQSLVTSPNSAYSRGDVVDLDSTDATKLLNAGLAVKALDLSGAVTAIGSAATSAGLTSMAAPSGTIPAGGGYYVESDGTSYVICNPSGQRRERFYTNVPSPAGVRW